MKDSALRNKWAKEENILCFEMEAAGRLTRPARLTVVAVVV